MRACTKIFVLEGEMTVLFLQASLAESSTKERTHREERTLRPMERSQHRYPRWCGGEGESHTPESLQVALQLGQGSKAYTHRWLACLNPSWMCACTHTHAHTHTHTHTHAHSPDMHVPVCLFPPPVLPQSALKHAPLPRLPGQLEAKVPDRGWGGSSKVEQCCQLMLTGGVLPQSGTLMGAATRWTCFLSHFVFLGLLCSSISRENSLAKGGGFRNPSGDLLLENFG